jgi:hypothetical protein
MFSVHFFFFKSGLVRVDLYDREIEHHFTSAFA